MLSFAISSGEAILIVVFATIPIAALTFALGSGKAFNQIGKGQFSVEFEHDLPQGLSDSDSDEGGAIRDAELRQLLEAKAYRQRARGEAPLDVDAEMKRISSEAAATAVGEDPQLVEEVRQLVAARNARRARRGEEPLDVEAEVTRQLRELESLGQ
ncbi:MAG: hypothetical protein ACR2G3_02315 [Solirubrobacterales bacterium]